MSAIGVEAATVESKTYTHQIDATQRGICGGSIEWKSGRVEEWKSGRVEEWKSGRVEGGKVESVNVMCETRVVCAHVPAVGPLRGSVW
jgi:hypothetical protein